MIAEVVALLMFIGPDIKEHRIQPNMATCLRGKRVAERVYKENIQKCSQFTKYFKKISTLVRDKGYFFIMV